MSPCTEDPGMRRATGNTFQGNTNYSELTTLRNPKGIFKQSFQGSKRITIYAKSQKENCQFLRTSQSNILKQSE